MRNYRNLPESEQIKLREQFPDLLNLARAEDVPGYHYLAVTVFDHWLSRDEANELLENVSEQEQIRRNDSLYKFSRKLASEADVISYKFCGRWSSSKPKFRTFASEKIKLEYLVPTVTKTSGSFFKVVIPDFSMVYVESWDDTNVMYLRDISIKNRLMILAKECGVHILERWNYQPDAGILV